jgi:hypothetical protein
MSGRIAPRRVGVQSPLQTGGCQEGKGRTSREPRGYSPRWRQQAILLNLPAKVLATAPPRLPSAACEEGSSRLR